MRAVIDDIGRTAAVSVLLFFAVGTMAGCQPSGKESLRDATGGGGPDGGDVLVDARPDAGMDGAGGDVAPDSTADAGDAIGMDASDGGGTDRDGDGVPNDEDNCPDQKNKEQADRDRDDVGNPCDHLPFIHDEKNPKSFDATTEDEKNQSNDSPREGRKYGLGLPFVIDGNVGPVEDEGDIDYYSFTVDEPTVLLLRVKPKSSEMWVGSITLGYQARNANIRPALFGGGPGRNGVRSIFLPVPGAYSIAVSDLRNFLPDNQQQDVPNNGKLKYRLSASAIPLPEPKKVSVPSRQNRTFDGTLNTYQVDTSDIDDLKVDAKGVSIGQRSIHDPLVYVYDRKAERTMSYTIGQQISDTQEVSLTTKLADDRSKVTVIEGFQRQLRNTSSVVEFADATVDSEFETIQTAQNKRTDRLVWLQPGMSVDGKINQPRTAGQNKRKPDTDFYLLSTRRGQAVRVTVEPTKNSKLKPSVAVGNYFEDPQRGSRFFDRRGHKIKAPNKAGKKRSVEFLYGSRTDGEVGIRVKHGPNDGADNPVGGGDYEYTIKVETFSPSPTKIGSLPTTE
ncbi:MAG: hypothetical protein ABEL76_12505, partial [Bradymonadaceae bacterium]